MSELQFNPEPYELTPAQKRQLVTLLFDCKSMTSALNSILEDLPKPVQKNFGSKSSSLENVMELLRTCLTCERGLPDLIESIAFYEQNSFQYQKLHEYLKDISIIKDVQKFSIEQIINHAKYPSKNDEFYNQVKNWLEIEGYAPEEVTFEFPGYWVAQKESIYYGILSFYNADDEIVFNDYVEAASSFLQKQKNNDSFAIVMFMTFQKPNREASSKLLSVLGGEKVVKFRYFEETIKNPLGLGKYLEHWEDIYYNQPISDESEPEKLRTLSQVYIPLRAERWRKILRRDIEREELTISLGSRHSLFTDFEYKKEILNDTLDIYVETWLNTPQTNPLAILATYGTGKSTFCTRLVATLNRMRAKDYSIRIPIIVQLAKLARTNASWQSLAQALVATDDYFSLAPDAVKLRKLAEAGKAVFILDGFDEMAIQANDKQLQYNLSFFNVLINIPNNKVILTSRPEYFLESSRRRKYLERYEELHLLLFDKDDIEEYVKRRTSADSNTDNFWKIISNIYDLSDLMQRAVFLEMIIKTFPYLKKISKKKNITRTKLYEAYLMEELHRQREKRDREGNPVHTVEDEERLRIMELIAIELFYQHKEGKGEGLTIQEIKKLATKYNLLESVVLQDIDAAVRDIAGCSFLICPQDKYYFSHTSFQEYLLAKRLCSSLQDNQPNIFRHSLISIPTLEFLAELTRDKNSSLIEVAEDWLDTSTDKEVRDGYTTFEIFQQNLAGLTLTDKVLSLNKNKISEFVTCSEYQLFVQSQMESKIYVQPIQWQKFHFKAGEALLPVRGIQLDQAEWFCEWLQGRHFGSYTYELPSIQPEQDYNFPKSDLGVWTIEGELIGLNDNKKFSIMAKLEQLGLSNNISINNSLSIDIRETFPEIDEIFDRPRPYDFSLALVAAFNLDKRFFSYLSNTVNVDDTFKSIEKLLNADRYKSAILKLKEIIQNDVDDFNKRTAVLAIDLVEMNFSENFADLRNAYCKFIYNLSNILLDYYNSRNNIHLDKIAEKKLAALSLKKWQIVANWRIQSQLESWEGIRFTRQRKETE